MALVLLWCMLMPLWMGRHCQEHGTTSQGESVQRAVPRHRPRVNLGLLAATLVTTTFAGATHQDVDLVRNPGAWTTGLPYALGVMLILGVLLPVPQSLYSALGLHSPYL